MIRTIVVDDEISAVTGLVWELQKFSDTIQVIETFTSAKEALSGINYLKPDCVFLDIEMPEMNGFSLLQKLDYRDLAVVITTAYDRYAIKAIKENALDYLLKPVDEDELKPVIQKLKTMGWAQSFQAQFQRTMEMFSRIEENKTLQIPVNGKILFIRPDRIIYCMSDGNYSWIYLESAKPLHVSKKLKELEEMLPGRFFYRTHNSYIVHLLKVTAYLRAEGYVVLTNDSKIPVSRNRKEDFLEKMAR